MYKYLSTKKYLLILLSAFIGLIFIVSFIITVNPTLGWESFSSDKVPLTFKHPKTWPVSKCTDLAFKPVFIAENSEEQLLFANECRFKENNNIVGSIKIGKVGEIRNPIQYLKDKNASPFALTDNFQIESKTLGFRKWYITNFKTDITGKYRNYYTYSSGFEYKAHLDNLTYQGLTERENITIFEKILSTFKF